MSGAQLLCVGLNHRLAPVELREQVAFSASRLPEALLELATLEGVKEAMILSTCNRVELYAAGDVEFAPFQLGRFLHRYHGLEPGRLDDYLFHLVGDDAVHHLFRVGASLDAIVVGEPQILGQLKDAYFQAAGARTAGPVINRALHRAFNVAKRVRTETSIAANAVSVSYAGVELARKIFGDVAGRDCLLVGAGEMAELAARHFVERGARIIIVNRSFERGRFLAEAFGGVARQWSELPSLLAEVDVALCSTSAPGFVISREMMRAALKRRRYRPLLLVDIAVPRDVDPAAGELEGVYVYDVDDLHAVVADNLEQRRGEAERAEELVREELLRFARTSREARAVPIIKALRRYMLEVALAEANKTLVVLGDVASERQKKSVDAMARAIVNKVLHEPIARLKEQSAVGAPSQTDLFAAVQELFPLLLDEEDGSDDESMVREAAEAAAVAAELDDTDRVEDQFRLAIVGK